MLNLPSGEEELALSLDHYLAKATWHILRTRHSQYHVDVSLERTRLSNHNILILFPPFPAFAFLSAGFILRQARSCDVKSRTGSFWLILIPLATPADRCSLCFQHPQQKWWMISVVLGVVSLSSSIPCGGARLRSDCLGSNDHSGREDGGAKSQFHPIQID